MLDLFFIIILTIALALLSGILHLVWLPFKNRLLRSGKLSDKAQKRIRWTFIIIPCALGVLMYCFKDYRTPSRERLESAADVKLPSDFKVLRDVCEDMTQDYCIFYDIQFDVKTTTQLTESIKSSKFYDKDNLQKIAWNQSDFEKTDTLFGQWSKSPRGFDFFGKKSLTSYNITFDTLTRILRYNECAE